MNSIEILKACRENAIKISVKNGALSISDPKKNLTEALLKEIKEKKAELLKALIGQQRRSIADFPMAKLSQVELDKVTAKYGEIEKLYVATPIQSGILFHGMAEQDKTVYAVQNSYELKGKFDLFKFEMAWKYLVQRHDILRTCFVGFETENIHQLVLSKPRVPISKHDLSKESHSAKFLKLEQIKEEQRETGFSFAVAPLFRLSLVSFSGSQHYFILTHHHCIMDGWSLPILFEELMHIYESMCSGKSPELQPSFPFESYVNWLSGQDSKAAIDYWQSTLCDYTSRTKLSTVTEPSTKIVVAKHEHTLSQAVSEKLLQVARKSHTTMNVLMQFILSLVMQKYLGEEQAIFGTTISGRPPELQGSERILGLFINTIPVLSSVNENDTISENLKRLHAENIEREQFSYLGLSEIKAAASIQPGQDLFECLYVYENYPVSSAESSNEPESGRLSIQASEGSESNNYPLTLTIAHYDRLTLRFEYKNPVISDSLIQKLSNYFTIVAEQLMTMGNDDLVRNIELVSDMELDVVRNWNNTKMQYEGSRFLHDIVAAKAISHPDRTALKSRSFSLNYQQLNAVVELLAKNLLQFVQPEDLVAIHLNRNINIVVAMMAVHKAGCAFLPLDPSTPKSRIKEILTDSESNVVICDPHHREVLQNVCEHTLLVDELGAPLMEDGYSHPNIEWPTISPNHLAYVIYTSGSTGKPKGVMIEHRQLLNFRAAMEDKFTEEKGVWGAVTTNTFDISILELLCPLTYGYSVLISNSTISQNSSSNIMLAEQLTEEEVTHLQCTPSLLSMLLLDDPEAIFMRNLKVLLVGGEALPMELMERLKRESGCKVFNMYGPTETTIWSTQKQITLNDDDVTVGRPIGNTHVFIADENLKLLPIGATGELLISGDGVGRGYLNRSELTEEKYVNVSWSGGERVYRTGDLAKFKENGELVVLGRIDDQVKIRGFRVELGEIETLISQMEFVQQQVVVAEQDDANTYFLTAYVTVEKTKATSESSEYVEEITKHLSDCLPAYMVPSATVVLEQMPLTANGKVNRKKLPKPETLLNYGNSIIEPRTQTERDLLDIWRNVLGHSQISIKDNFFSIGGHSLSVTRAISSIRTKMGMDISYKQFFDNPTISSLASLIDNSGLEAVIPEIVKLPNKDRVPLSFSQQRLWLINQLDTDAQYTLPSVYQVFEELDKNAFKWAVNSLVERHEVFRTTYHEDDGIPYQVVNPPCPVPINEIDMTGVAEQDIDCELNQLAHENAQKAFDLKNDVMLRVTLIKVRSKHYVIHLNMHHIAFDGWSMDILEEEFMQLYMLAIGKSDTGLPELPLQYADFASWQRQWLQGEVLDTQLEYWKKQLSDVPQVHCLPLDTERKANANYQQREFGQIFDAEFTSELHAYCQRQDVTLYMLLQTAFSVLIGRYSGECDVVMGSPISGRFHQSVEKLIGFFVNTLVLRSSLDMNRSFEAQLQYNKNMILEAHEHQHVPFEMLVDELVRQRSLSHSPLFQILFNFAVQKSSSDIDEAFIDKHVGSEFDLELVVAQGDGTLNLGWSFRTDIFLNSTIKRLASSFKTLLKSIISGESKSLFQLHMIDESGRNDLLLLGRGELSENINTVSLNALFEEQVRANPTQPAVVYEGQQLSYEALNDYANQLAGYLQSEGVGPGDFVGVYLPRSLEMVVALLSVLKAGAAYVPMDPAYSAQRLVHIVTEAKPKQIITLNSMMADLQLEQQAFVCLDNEQLQSSLRAHTADLKPVDSTASAYVLYTSGSTGRPKGIEISHRSAVAMLAWARRTYTDKELSRVLCCTSINFDLSVFELFVPLCFGFRCILVDNGLSLLDSGQSDEVSSVTLINTVPSVMALLLEQGAVPPSVTVVNLAGEPLPSSTVNRLLKETAVMRVFNLYGPSEDTTYSTFAEFNAPVSEKPWIGGFLDNGEGYVLDAYGELLPQGCTGELYLGGAGLAKGYLNQPALTDERFVPNPFGEGRLYRTGDLVRWRPDGALEYIGRNDSQVKLRGFRIELGEIEHALQGCEGVDTAVVQVHRTETTEQLVAYIESQDEAIQSVCEAALSSRLPAYMVPSVYIVLEQMPLLPNGKVDRHSLPAPTDADLQTEVYVAPETETEHQLCEIWQSLLGVERVGVKDNFFSLGGHSLLATQLVSRVRQNFQLVDDQVNLRAVFDSPTVRELAVHIDKKYALNQIQKLEKELEESECLEEGLL